MRRSVFLASVCLSLFAMTVGLATAGESSALKVRALPNAKQEVPPQAFRVSKASGRFFGTLTKTNKGYRLSWQLSFSNLSGKATSAIIHRGRRGKQGATVWILCSPCTSGAHGSAYASPGEVGLILQGRTYVNVETKKNPSGEIRGQIF